MLQFCEATKANYGGLEEKCTEIFSKGVGFRPPSGFDSEYKGIDSKAIYGGLEGKVYRAFLKAVKYQILIRKETP